MLIYKNKFRNCVYTLQIRKKLKLGMLSGHENHFNTCHAEKKTKMLLWFSSLGYARKSLGLTAKILEKRSYTR